MANIFQGSAALGIASVVNLNARAIIDRRLLKLLGRSTWTQIQKAALKEVVQHWHDNIFPRHFQRGNQSRYRFEKRTDLYLKKIKPAKGRGKGKNVLESLKGESERAMKHFYRISGSSKQMTLSMLAPRYFTRPFVGAYLDRFGRRKQITRQPDKPAEVTQVNEEDRIDMRRQLRSRLRELVNAHLNAGSGI